MRNLFNTKVRIILVIAGLITAALVIMNSVGMVTVPGVLTQGLVIALYNYMTQILVELVKMASLIITMTKAAACGGRIQQMLENGGNGTEKAKNNEKKDNFAVSFKNVWMAGTIKSAMYSARLGGLLGHAQYLRGHASVFQRLLPQPGGCAF